MKNKNVSFGRFLFQLRESHAVTLRELARKVGVSAPYLSDVEKDKKAPLTAEKLEKTADALRLSLEEKNQLFDIAGWQRNTVAPDLTAYIMEKDYVRAALRVARDLDVGEAKWKNFIKELKAEQKG